MNPDSPGNRISRDQVRRVLEAARETDQRPGLGPSREDYIARVRKDWITWVPILFGVIRYDDRDKYTADQLREMNVAIELMVKEQTKGGKPGRGVKKRGR